MSRFPTFTRTLREQRIPAIAWSVALVALGFVHVLMFPQYRDAASVLDQNAYYQALAGEAGSVGSPAGYLNVEYFNGVPLMVLIFAIIAGTGMIAAEQASGTLDFVLAQPLRRSRFVIEKAAALAVLVVVVSMASLPGLILATFVVDFDLSIARMAAACLTIVPLTLLFASIALFGSAVLRSRIEATVIGIGAALAGFFLNVFGAFADALEGPRKLSPFYWTNYGKALTGGWDWTHAALFVGAAVGIAALTAVLFERRDLGTPVRRLRWWRRTFPQDNKAPTLGATSMLTAPGRFPTLRRTLREQRIQFTAWGLMVLLLGFITVVIYPSFHDAFAAFDQSGAFQEFAGEAGSVSSPAGYLNSEFFSYIPLLILIAVVIAGTGSVAGEESAGTLDLVLAQPVSRRRVLLEKTAALLILLVGVVLAGIPGLIAAKLIVDFDMSVLKVTLAALYMIPLALLFLSLAVFSSAALANRTAATILVVGAAIAGYFLNTLGVFVDALEQPRKLSPFYWADFSRVMLHGFDFGRAAVFVAISLAFVAAAVIVLEGRDIATHTTRFRRGRERSAEGATGAAGMAAPRAR
jgi:ABC-2 type transport system permease protein